MQCDIELKAFDRSRKAAATVFFHQFVFEWSVLLKPAHLLMKNESENRTDCNLKDYFSSKIRRFDPSKRFQRSLIEPK